MKCIMGWCVIHIHCEMTTWKLFSLMISFQPSLVGFSISLAPRTSHIYFANIFSIQEISKSIRKMIKTMPLVRIGASAWQVKNTDPRLWLKVKVDYFLSVWTYWTFWCSVSPERILMPRSSWIHNRFSVLA